jgi:hypothetical protein
MGKSLNGWSTSATISIAEAEKRSVQRKPVESLKYLSNEGYRRETETTQNGPTEIQSGVLRPPARTVFNRLDLLDRPCESFPG